MDAHCWISFVYYLFVCWKWIERLFDHLLAKRQCSSFLFKDDFESYLIFSETSRNKINIVINRYLRACEIRCKCVFQSLLFKLEQGDIISVSRIIYFNYLNQTTWQNVNPRKFIIFGIKYCTDILLTSGCFSWENRNWFIWGSCWQMTYRKLNYSQHQNHKNEPFCSEERILSLAMPKPAFIDRNGWEHIVLSQNPVYQVIHRWYPGHIPDSLEMTKPRLFLAQGKFLNVCIFETGVCGHPVSWQWIALARNSPVAPFCPPLHPTPEGLCYQGGTNEHCKYKSEKKRRISHLSSNFLCFVISEGASGVFFFPFSASCLYLLGKNLNRWKTIN